MMTSLVVSFLHEETGCLEGYVWYAVTLTLGPHLPTHEARYLAQGNLRHFLNTLNRRVFGNKFTREGLRLPCVAVLEGNDAVRPHYHLLVGKPLTFREEEFIAHFEKQWPRTHYGAVEVHMEPCDAGWLHYMLKKRTKDNYELSIDWTNTFLGVRGV